MHQPSPEDKKNKKHYFQIDVNSLSSFDAFSEWLKDILDTSYNIEYIPGFPFISLPVTDLNPIYGGSFMPSIPLYLGNNQYNEPIYKTKHFVVNSIKNEYIKHLQNNATHFIKQPTYYKGLFDIMN